MCENTKSRSLVLSSLKSFIFRRITNAVKKKKREKGEGYIKSIKNIKIKGLVKKRERTELVS